MASEKSQFLNRIYIGFFILFVLFLIYFYTGNTAVQYAVVTIASVMFVISWWMSSKLFKIIGGAFLLIGFLLAFVSGISFSETIVHIIDNMNLLLFLSLLPFINTVIQVGGMEESIVSLIEDQKGRLDKIYNRTIMTTYVLTIFLNISSIYIVQNVLGKILNGEDRNVRIHFIAKSTLRAFGLAVMWSPIEILVGISIDETGASYFQVIPWIILISIIMYLYEMKKVSTEFSQIQIDVGTIESFFDAHMDLISALPIFNLYNREWPIYTQTVNAPPAKFTRDAWGRAADVNEAIVGAGSVVQGASVVRSVVSPWCTIDAGATVSDAILFDQVHVGAGAVVRRAIIDKGVEIGPGVQIGVDHDADRARGFSISASGIVTVPKGSTIL